MSKTEPTSFTGRARRRTTRRGVKAVDALAKWVITLGGLGVIVALALLVLFLGSVTLPLFQGAEITPDATGATQVAAGGDVEGGGGAVVMRVDGNLTALWTLDGAGELSVYRRAGGELVRRERLSDVPVTAVSTKGSAVAFGREDGSAVVGTIGFDNDFLADKPDATEAMKEGDTIVYEDGVVELVRGNLRRVRVGAELSDPVRVGKGLAASPIRLIDYLRAEGREALIVVRADGEVLYELIRKRTNMMTGEETVSLSETVLPRPDVDADPAAALLTRNGRGAYLVYADGTAVRYDLTGTEPRIVEVGDVLPEDDRTVTAVRMLAGNVTLIVGDSGGGVAGWFAAPTDQEGTADGYKLVEAHTFADGPAAVTDVRPSERDRQFVTGDAAGHVIVRFMVTAEREAEVDVGAPVRLVEISPSNDALLAMTDDGSVVSYAYDNRHPGGELAALFSPIHYEGYAGPGFEWQSGGAEDSAEPKQSVVPLIFGTAKATLSAMLLAVPLGILAAIYSSEFMSARVRSVVKPSIEMMAGLPSVVLGFVGGLVLAPYVQAHVVGALLVFVAVPLGVILFGYVWQLLPPHVVRPLPAWVPFLVMLATVAGVGAFTFFAFGTFIEGLLFGGNVKGWLQGQPWSTTPGYATVGWAVLLAPALFVVLVVLFNVLVRPRLDFYRTDDRVRLALTDLGRIAVTAGLAVGVAWLGGRGLAAAGGDIRNPWTLLGFDLSPVGTYDQRNALIIGIVMGFAVIPIIYTVSEDALSSVPSQLRSAALGAGATPWQTAIKVVLPVAASGIFSACMIGLGRAAGETMIVLMATGNTPLLDANLFNGLRTLSANIAVELPEAPVGETLYRRLFLFGVLLFGLTFVLNTAAEFVRQRFRRRAVNL